MCLTTPAAIDNIGLNRALSTIIDNTGSVHSSGYVVVRAMVGMTLEERLVSSVCFNRFVFTSGNPFSESSTNPFRKCLKAITTFLPAINLRLEGENASLDN